MDKLHGASVSIGTKHPQRKIKKRLICVLLIIIFYFICSLGPDLFFRATPDTRDAYITGNPVLILSETAGRVAAIAPANSDSICKGDILLQMENHRQESQFKQAEQNLLEAEKETHERYIADSQNNAHILYAQMAYQQALIEYNRRLQSIGPAAISQNDLRQALKNVNSSKAALDLAIQHYRRNLLRLHDADIAQQQLIVQARNDLQNAAEALERTRVRSPVSGYVAQRNVHPGLDVSPGQTLMTIVPADQMWINANFTAAELTDVRVGQKALILTELYGNNVVFDGKVEGWNQDADAALSVLSSAEKWISEVRKISVRISINPMQMSQYPLRIGVSTRVKLLNHPPHSPPLTLVRKGLTLLRAYRKYLLDDDPA